MKPFQKNLNEVKALATLSNIECANIVRYHNSWIENSRLFMVMEYCEKSLKKTIDEYRKKCIIFT
jgi:serine/threonine protein kinase